MAGALTERVFVEKMHSVGLSGVEVRQRQAFGLQDAAAYPLFTPDLIELMEDLLSPEQQTQVAMAITVTAEKPA